MTEYLLIMYIYSHYLQVSDWMSREAGLHIPIYRHHNSTSSGEPDQHGPQIPIRRYVTFSLYPLSRYMLHALSS